MASEDKMHNADIPYYITVSDAGATELSTVIVPTVPPTPVTSSVYISAETK